jgi:hypothetical protein
MLDYLNQLTGLLSMVDLELVELDFCCPECHCSEWYSINDDGFYACARCNYVCLFDFENELVSENHD